jgi:hypothetical protein
VLTQFLTTCPGCGGTAAAHVDTSSTQPVLVRSVCHKGCLVDAAAVLTALGLLAEAAPLPAA